MSKKDTSLEKIDPVKLLLFIFAFIVVCFIMIFGFIVPNIKEFKSLTRQNYSQTSSYTKVKNEFEAKFKALEATKQKDGAIISAFETKSVKYGRGVRTSWEVEKVEKLVPSPQRN